MTRSENTFCDIKNIIQAYFDPETLPQTRRNLRKVLNVYGDQIGVVFEEYDINEQESLERINLWKLINKHKNELNHSARDGILELNSIEVFNLVNRTSTISGIETKDIKKLLKKPIGYKFISTKVCNSKIKKTSVRVFSYQKI